MSARPGGVWAAWVVGAGAVALVVMVALGVLPHTGTGRPLDPWHALVDVLAAPRTWLVTGAAAAAGAVVGAAHAIVIRRRG
ncbi:hypothetical protein [Xylanimonas ulmi]|uniref:Uncharacterized protein n=1 Tax=Xylanimonas ulmi TaxID=228973 RepID=A0A4Q7M613_9MICO|nr:hypothetical protein [Xylanibacterium ulmi]RZS63104.1 hypothetical protein EV386_3462 [Xylanibacterium ulmi]